MTAALVNFFRHRTLVAVLVSRELKARYRGSVLGFFWSLLNPLLLLAVYSVVFQYILPNRTESTSPYAIFLFCGLLPWNWLASAVSDAAASLVTNGSLLRKILFPAEVLPAVAVLSQGVHFLLAFPVLLAGLVAGRLGLFGVPVRLGAPILQVPAIAILQAVFVFGIGLFLAALTIHFRDVKDLLQTILSLGFFATPILYTLSDLKGVKWLRLLRLNPLAVLFSAWHDALFYSRWVAPATWGLLVLMAGLSFLLGYAFFHRLRDSYPEAV